MMVASRMSGATQVRCVAGLHATEKAIEKGQSKPKVVTESRRVHCLTPMPPSKSTHQSGWTARELANNSPFQTS